jgi:hypothetical protein
MASTGLPELIEFASQLEEPQLIRRLGIATGGVDPLGLRQINFDLMDLVIPGLNNVARHIRPFTVIAWAWHRAALCASKTGRSNVVRSELQDFVDRIEVIFAWSQFLRDSDADLPGHDVLAPLVTAETYTFGGSEWKERCDKRRFSTALSAPVNYGPAVKALGWIEPSVSTPGAFKSTEMVKEALKAIDTMLGSSLAHPAFSSLGEITLSQKQVKDWADRMAIEQPSAQERAAMRESLSSDTAREGLRQTVTTIAEIDRHQRHATDQVDIRSLLCRELSEFPHHIGFESVPILWRLVQVRQLFRLTLEALLHWIMIQLTGGPAQLPDLAETFLSETRKASTTKKWLSTIDVNAMSIPERIRALENSLSANDRSLAESIHAGFAVSLLETGSSPIHERSDRLPLKHAREEAASLETETPFEFVKHILSSWVLGQHVYWAVGRGLADARSNGRTILRLKVVLEEGLWTLAPGAAPNFANPPRATPDRLATLISLMQEVGSFKVH